LFQEEILKAQPKTLYSALQSAQNFERIRQSGNRGKSMASSLADESEEELDFDEDDNSDMDGRPENGSVVI